LREDCHIAALRANDLDNAGWHSQANLTVPKGIRLVFLPPYTPELQPAEPLLEPVDEPIVNQLIPDIQTLKGRVGFYWWPKIADAS